MNKAVMRELSLLIIVLLILGTVLAAPIVLNKGKKSASSTSDSAIVLKKTKNINQVSQNNTNISQNPVAHGPGPQPLGNETCTITDDTYINTDTILDPDMYCEINDPDDNGVLIINASDVTLDCNELILIGNDSGYGIDIEGDNVVIKNCHIEHYNNGIAIDSDNAYTSIHNNVINLNNFGIISMQFSSGHICNHHIFDNTINSNSFSGIYLHYYCSNNNITHNNLSHNFHQGILLTENNFNNIISNNFINRSNGGVGIYLSSNTNNNEIYDNKLYSTDMGTGIFITESNYNKIERNSIIDNYYGIYLSKSPFTFVSENSIYGNSYAGFFIPHSEKTLIEDNEISSNGKGIDIQNSENIFIARNNFTSNEDSGIVIRDSLSNFEITGNRIENGYFYGVILDNSSYTNITKNSFCNNSNYAIYFETDTTNSLVVNNNIVNNAIGLFVPPGTAISQAYDDDATSSNEWNNTINGNYWDDYSGVGPYVINGSANSKDYVPLMNQYPDAPICPTEGNGGGGNSTGQVNVSDIEILYGSVNTTGSGNWDVYGINSDSSNKKPISNEISHSELTPVWSPDNSKMSYLSDESGYLDIWIMDFDNGSRQQLTFGGTEATYADWSPNGDKLVFATDSNIDMGLSCNVISYISSDNDCELFTINSDGTSLTQITNDSFPDLDPKWSPINNKIVFSSDRTGTFDIFTINSDGTDLTQITNSSLIEATPAWTQDGSKIIYTTINENTSQAKLMIMDTNGANKQEIISFNDSAPIWPSPSPDGTQITYTKFNESGYIYVVNADGTGNAPLTFSGYDLFSDWKNSLNMTLTPPDAPHIEDVILRGSNFANVMVYWEPSPDDPPNVDNYTVSSFCYTPGGGGGGATGTQVIADGSELYSFVFIGQGDGNLDTCLYDVTANNAAGSTPADNRGGKFARTLTNTPGNHDYLLSIPFIQGDTSILAVLKTLNFTYAQYYNSSAKKDPWKHWNENKPEYMNDLQDIDHTMGFYISLKQHDNFTVAGIIPQSTTIPLKKGWNMVGYPSLTEKNVSEAFSGIDYNKIRAVEEFNPNYKKMGDSDIMYPGQGYWVHTDINQDWIVDW